MRVFLLPSLAAALATAIPAGPARAQDDPGLGRLERELARLAEPAQGVVGVGAIHLETGREVYLSRGERFPMASTYKVPIAVQLLARVDDGQVSLDSLVTVEPADLHPGSGTIADLLDDPGVILSVRNLLELMLLISDNSATDLTLRVAGGGDAVTDHVRTLGIEGVSVNRPTVDLIADWLGIADLPPRSEWNRATFEQAYMATTEEQRDSAAAAFDIDPRDTATPEGMALLLARLWRGELLSESSTDLLTDIMRRCETGENRLKGLLPPQTEVAHKTGTIGGTTNDVGVITLPDDAGHVVAVVFVKQSDTEVPDRERVIAHIARALYDYFTFDTGER